MFCANCGKENSADQRFCRACGMNLEIVSTALAETLGENAPPPAERATRIERWGKIIGLTGIGMLMLLIMSAVICIAISKIAGFNFDDLGFAYFAPVILAVALPLLFAGAVMAGYSNLSKEIATLRPPKSKRLSQAEPTTRISVSAALEPTPSVTEHTTERLDVTSGGGRVAKEARDTRPTA